MPHIILIRYDSVENYQLIIPIIQKFCALLGVQRRCNGEAKRNLIFSRMSWTKISKNTYWRCAVWQIITSTQSWRQKASFTLPCSTQGRDYKISQSIKNSFFQNLVRKVIGPNIPLPFWEAPILQGSIHGTELPWLAFGHNFW